MPELDKDGKHCTECGMPVQWGDYHPYAACLMFKGCGDAETVNKHLNAIKDQWYELGKRKGLTDAIDATTKLRELNK